VGRRGPAPIPAGERTRRGTPTDGKGVGRRALRRPATKPQPSDLWRDDNLLRRLWDALDPVADLLGWQDSDWDLASAHLDGIGLWRSGGKISQEVFSDGLRGLRDLGLTDASRVRLWSDANGGDAALFADVPVFCDPQPDIRPGWHRSVRHVWNRWARSGQSDFMAVADWLLLAVALDAKNRTRTRPQAVVNRGVSDTLKALGASESGRRAARLRLVQPEPEEGMRSISDLAIIDAMRALGVLGPEELPPGAAPLNATERAWLAERASR
jgi:hypothetical protein